MTYQSLIFYFLTENWTNQKSNYLQSKEFKLGLIEYLFFMIKRLHILFDVCSK